MKGVIIVLEDGSARDVAAPPLQVCEKSDKSW